MIHTEQLRVNWIDTDDLLCLTGKIVAVAVGPERTSIPLPADFREVLERARRA